MREPAAILRERRVRVYDSRPVRCWEVLHELERRNVRRLQPVVRGDLRNKLVASRLHTLLGRDPLVRRRRVRVHGRTRNRFVLPGDEPRLHRRRVLGVHINAAMPKRLLQPSVDRSL